MKVALSVWENHLSPVFDSSRRLLVVDVEKGMITGKRYESFDSTSPFFRAKRLSELGIEVLISGAISQFLASMIEAYGIRIVCSVTGDVNQVLEAYLHDKLWTEDFRMSG